MPAKFQHTLDRIAAGKKIVHNQHAHPLIEITLAELDLITFLTGVRVNLGDEAILIKIKAFAFFGEDDGDAKGLCRCQGNGNTARFKRHNNIRAGLLKEAVKFLADFAQKSHINTVV